jgi:hypothetical protein
VICQRRSANRFSNTMTAKFIYAEDRMTKDTLINSTYSILCFWIGREKSRWYTVLSHQISVLCLSNWATPIWSSSSSAMIGADSSAYGRITLTRKHGNPCNLLLLQSAVSITAFI